jgi:hypothetical protein
MAHSHPVSPPPLAAVVLLLAFLSSPLEAQRASLAGVLAGAGRYVSNYELELADVIADEHYVQQGRPVAGGRPARRELLAEFALVRLGEEGGWTGFRDVIEVDGQRVHDREGRLLELFARAPATAARQARRIADESARFNLGALRRNFNEPTMALAFLVPDHQGRFRFKKDSEATIDGLDVWVVRYTERRRGTFIRTPGGRDIPAQGRFFIDPRAGRVVRTELVLRDFLAGDDLPPGRPRRPIQTRAEINVTFRPDDRLGIWVPAEMHELYTGPWTLERVTPEPEQHVDLIGTATYSNYRRFVTDARIVRPGERR